MKSMTADRPFERLAMDFVGPVLPENGYQYILVITDYLTGWPEAYPLRDRTAKSVAHCVYDLSCRYGVPEIIHTDQGA